jgi:hypothetical protein
MELDRIKAFLVGLIKRLSACKYDALAGAQMFVFCLFEKLII